MVPTMISSTIHRKENRLEPVLNLTLYWGRKTWKNPLSLKDMMRDMTGLPLKLQRLAGDYRVHLISMRFIPEKDLYKMDSDLKYVLGIMKHTASRKRYEKYISENREYFSRIPRSAVDVIDACTNIKDIRNCLRYTLNEESGEEETDMCKALDDIKKDATKQGVKQGLKQGIKQGIKQGVEQGVRQGTCMTLFSLVSDGLLKLEEAAKRANLSEPAFRREMKKAGVDFPAG